MSKARRQSLTRSLSRGLKGREKGINSKGEILYKEPRIISEFVDTIGKLLILKRPTTGHNKTKVNGRGITLKKRPYYNIIQSI